MSASPNIAGRHTQIAPMGDDELKSIIKNEIEKSAGIEGSEISQERRRALRHYHGKAFGNEIEGRSKVVLTPVADTIDWILPDLMRMFLGEDAQVRFRPQREEDVEAAKLASKVCSSIFINELDGYRVLWTAFFDALLQKNGIVKCYWEERYEPKVQRWEAISDMEAALILESGDWDPIAHEELGVNPQDPGGGTLHTIEARRLTPTGRIRLDNVPPEEHIIAERAIKQDDECPFSGHRKRQSVGDLIALGIDPEIAESLPMDDITEYNSERTERRSATDSFPFNNEDRQDAASRTVWTTECYIKVDQDGDGYSELKRVLIAGENTIEILENKMINHQPFVVFVPHPLPHRFYGRSIDDTVGDLQRISSHIFRSQLDNLNSTQFTRYEVVEGAVEIDDLLTTRPGGIVRVSAPGMIKELPTTQMNPTQAGVMDYIEGVRQMRTGSGVQNQGMDASVFRNQTATGVSQYMAAATGKRDCIARNLKEGVKDLFRQILRLLVESPAKLRYYEIDGKWMQIDASEWNPEMEVDIEVGLGAGESGQRIANMMNLLQVDQAVAASPHAFIKQPKDTYNSLVSIATAMNLAAPEQFWTDPGDQQPPDPGPDPTVALQMQAKQADTARREKDDAMTHAENAEKFALEISKEKALAEFRYAELDKRTEVDEKRIASQERIAIKQMDAQIEIAKQAAQKSATPTGAEKKPKSKEKAS